MNVVEPIRDEKIVKAILHHFKTSSNRKRDRDHLLFMFGIYTGLRISDILKVKKSDITGKHLFVREQKTGKRKRILIVSPLKRELDSYLTALKDDDYIFHGNERSKPITRARAYQILNEAAELFGLEHIGTHSLRKTFGYFMYRETKNAAMLQEIFNHSSEAITLRYIGITQDAIDDEMKKLPKLFR